MKATNWLVAVVLLAATAWAQGNMGMQKTATKPAAKPAGAFYWSSSQGKWSEVPGVAGLHTMVASGDPSKGGSVMYAKVDPGMNVPWHWHSVTESLYGESGRLQVGMFKSDKTVEIGSGVYAKMPARMVHRASCVSREACMFYVETSGPFDMHLVDENGKEIKPAMAKTAKGASMK